jgi:hypothetical protein
MIELDSYPQNMALCATISPTFTAIARTLRSVDHSIQKQRRARTESGILAVGRFK